eukprot:bmy_22395T0
MTPRDPSHLSLLLSESPEHACIQGTTPTNPKQRGTHRRRSGSYSNGKPEVCQQPEAELRSESSAASGVCRELVRFESTWSRGREGRGLKAGGGGDEGSPFPGAGASGSFASSGGCGRACCEMDTPPLSGSDSDSDDSLVTDKELQEAFSRGLLKPGLNVVLEGPKKAVNDVNGLKQCLAEFKRDLEWVERLDVTLGPVPGIRGPQATSQNTDQKAVDPEDDFQREMNFYCQAQAAVLAVLPRLRQLKVPTKRPTDYFAEMAKSDQQMQKIRQKLQAKQAAMEKSEKAKQLRALRKYGKKVQTEVLQKRQREKAHMMSAIKKYQKGFSDKLDFLEGDQKPVARSKKEGAKGQQMKKGPSAKRRYKNQKFGYGGKKKGSKWNTRESYDDVSSFRAKTAHGKGLKRPGKKGSNKRPGKRTREKMKSRTR